MLKISKDLLQETLDVLKASTNKEKVILWFGKNNSCVCEAFEPMQFAEYDYFEIPQEGLQAIIEKVKTDKIIVIAQIHTHPGRAFHSRADDVLALPRHIGAYSLVLPRFAIDTNIDNFLKKVSTYRLNNQGAWVKVTNDKIQIYE